MVRESDEVVVTGSRAPSSEFSSTAPATEAAPAPPRPVQPLPQSGILTAGDYDDLLNPGMYGTWVSNYLQDRRDYPVRPLDVAQAVTLRVTDTQGAPLPFAWLTIDRGQRPALTLSTGADGEAVIFPAHDGLGDFVQVTARRPDGAGRSASIGFRPAELSRDRTVQLSVDARAERPRQLDLALVIDTTGSMGDELRYIQSELRSIVDWLGRELPGVDVRVGLIVYRDQGDEYVSRVFPLTGDVQQLQGALAAQSANGGGDYPEAMQVAMAQAYDLDWRRDAVRVAMLVADAPPHEQDVAATWAAAERAREGRIHIVPVAASGVAEDAEYLMRGMAALTQSRYLFLTDDSGVGLPHDTPEVKCYQVTRLDSLVRRVLAGLVRGERVEADPQEVIRTVGHYDEGVCRAG